MLSRKPPEVIGVILFCQTYFPSLFFHVPYSIPWLMLLLLQGRLTARFQVLSLEQLLLWSSSSILREEESEGSRRQSSGLMNKNCI